MCSTYDGYWEGCCSPSHLLYFHVAETGRDDTQNGRYSVVVKATLRLFTQCPWPEQSLHFVAHELNVADSVLFSLYLATVRTPPMTFFHKSDQIFFWSCRRLFWWRDTEHSQAVGSPQSEQTSDPPSPL